MIVLRAKPRRVTTEGSRDNRGPTEMWNLVVNENNWTFIALAHNKHSDLAGEGAWDWCRRLESNPVQSNTTCREDSGFF